MSMSKLSSSVAVLSGLVLTDAGCIKFSSRFRTPESIATDLWYGAFKYTVDEANAYDMWPDASPNPNDVLTERLVRENVIEASNSTHFDRNGFVDKCFLGYDYHKGMNESVANDVHPINSETDAEICSPWAERSCCDHSQVNDIEAFRTLFADWYDAGGAICGALSPACEQFFVEEECMYACSPNAGLFRNYRLEGSPEVSNTWALYDPLNEDHNEWEMNGMPIKASWFDNMWEACKNDNLFEADSPTPAASNAQALSVSMVGVAATMVLLA